MEISKIILDGLKKKTELFNFLKTELEIIKSNNIEFHLGKLIKFNDFSIIDNNKYLIDFLNYVDNYMIIRDKKNKKIKINLFEIFPFFSITDKKNPIIILYKYK